MITRWLFFPERFDPPAHIVDLQSDFHSGVTSRLAPFIIVVRAKQPPDRSQSTHFPSKSVEGFKAEIDFVKGACASHVGDRIDGKGDVFDQGSSLDLTRYPPRVDLTSYLESEEFRERIASAD